MASHCVCGEFASSRCEACRDIRYCGRECQRADWRGHKRLCQGLAGRSKKQTAKTYVDAMSRRLGKEFPGHMLQEHEADHAGGACSPLALRLLSRANQDAFLSFLVKLGRPVIELGSGNGRLAGILEEMGLDVVTIDPDPASHQLPCMSAKTPNFRTVQDLLGLLRDADKSGTERSKKIAATIRSSVLLVCSPPPAPGGESMCADFELLARTVPCVALIFRTDGSDMCDEMLEYAGGMRWKSLFAVASTYENGCAAVAASVAVRCRDTEKPVKVDKGSAIKTVTDGLYVSNVRSIYHIMQFCSNRWKELQANCIIANSRQFVNTERMFSDQFLMETAKFGEEMMRAMPPGSLQMAEANYMEALEAAIRVRAHIKRR